MPTGKKLERKNAYMAKLIDLIESCVLALIVDVDHVGSKQMQHIRGALRGKATVLMGKNTMIRTAIRKRMEALTSESSGEEDSDVTAGHQAILENVNGNMGFIFCHSAGAMQTARDTLNEFVVPAAARAGVVAPKDVFIPAGPTNLEPSQTSFFQAMNIPTKIVKGSIEVTQDFRVVTAGERVALSAQALLTKLGVRPFEYGMKVRQVYQDKCVFDAAVLDINDSVLVTKFMKGVSNVAAFGREIGIPTEAGLPHMICSAFKNIISVVADLDVDMSGSEKLAEIVAILKDPEALAAMKAAAASGPASGGGGASGGAAAPAAAAAVEEEEEEMEFDLF